MEPLKTKTSPKFCPGYAHETDTGREQRNLSSKQKAHVQSTFLAIVVS